MTQWTALLCISILVLCASASKLNVPRILLPVFPEISTNFTLEATEGGCYKWTTTRTDVITLTPLNLDEVEDCSTRVVVSTASHELTRNIAVVLAEDITTNQVLRCDVIIDAIHSLTITTTTRELFMEEAPEAFEVRAYDDQGNEFTSVEGIEFAWSLETRDAAVLRFINFKDSPYETPAHIAELEVAEKRGYVVLLEGIKTGTAKISVNLPQPGYSHVRGCEVHLSVIANLIVLPADTYIMAGDTVTLRVINMNNGRMEEVLLSDSQYYFQVEDAYVASVQAHGLVSGFKEGKTKVVLHDPNLLETDLKLPSATVHVVVPAYMTIALLPHRNWAVVTGDRHEVVVDIYEKKKHRLHIGNNAQIQVEICDLFHVEQRSDNGSWVAGWAQKQGSCAVHASLAHPKLWAEAEMVIFAPITLSPARVVLPWDPLLKPKYEIEMTARGGGDRYVWSSSNHSVGMVTQAGHVKTHSHGSLRVTAAMQRNHNVKRSSIIHVRPPTLLEIVEFIAEAEVGSPIHLHLALFAKKIEKDGSVSGETAFSDCNDLPFKIKSADLSFVQNKTARPETRAAGSCGSVTVVTSKVAISRITVSYMHNGNVLEDSATVTTFLPLLALYPRQRQIVLAVGSSANLVFDGGPRPVTGRSSAHNRAITVDYDHTATITDSTKVADHIGGTGAIVLNVLCRKIGSTIATLSVWNTSPLEIATNRKSISTVTVICGKPRSISLQPKIKVADVNSCPMDLSADRVVVQSYSDIELNVDVLDEKGRRFANVSSLKFAWTISPADLGELVTRDGVLERTVEVGGVVVANTSYQIVAPKSQTGMLEVTATIVEYKKEVLKFYKISPEWPEFTSDDDRDKQIGPIQGEIYLYLVDEAVVTPNVTSVYNHGDNRQLLSVQQGSGYYYLALSSTTIADVRYLESTRQLEILPLNEGELTVNLVDLCLVSQPVSIAIKVVSVAAIQIEIDNCIEIGRTVPVTVWLFDEFGSPIDMPDDLGMAKLIANVADSLITLRENRQDEARPGKFHYTATGVQLGYTKLSFSIGKTASATLDVQVFPPLKIHPRNITMIVGSTMQFVSKGGPQPDGNVEYSVGTSSVASIEVGGFGRGLQIGHTKVEAWAVGLNPVTGAKIIYSHDAAELHVIALTGVKICSSLTRFRVGGRVPVWVGGIPEKLSPLVLGSVEPPFQFEWSIDASEIAGVQHTFQDTGIAYLPEDSVSIRLLGLKPGRTTLRLKVFVLPNVSNKKRIVHSATMELEVFEELTLTSPHGFSTRRVLMAPQSVLELSTNLDGVGKLRYSTELSKQANAIVTVSDKGVLKSKDALGQAVVMIIAADKQMLTVIVEVKPVHYMLLNPRTNWMIEKPINTIPMGSEFQLVPSYHDDTGAEFTSASPEILMRSTRSEIAHIRTDNSTIIVSTRKTGSSVLKAWASTSPHHRTIDYLKLHVTNFLAPTAHHLTTGDVVCLWTPVVRADGGMGRWTSSDSSLVLVDKVTGFGRVNRGGQIALGHSLHPGAALQMQVVVADELLLLPEPDVVITNAPGSPVIRLPLVMRNSQDGEKRTNLLHGWQCNSELTSASINYNFRCYIEFTNSSAAFDISDLFTVKSGFNFETGQYTCDLNPTGNHGERFSTLISNLTVWVHLLDGSAKSKPVILNFAPAIHVADELFLEDWSLRAAIVVTGVDYVLDQVDVKPYDSSLFSVSNLHRPKPNTLVCDIQLIDYHSKLQETRDLLSIVVTSELTAQHVKVHVDTHNVESLGRPVCRAPQQSPVITFLYNNQYGLKIGMSVVVILVVTYFVYRCMQPFTSSVGQSDSSYFRAGPNASLSPNSYIEKIRPDSSPRRPLPFRNTDQVYGDSSTFFGSTPEFRRRPPY